MKKLITVLGAILITMLAQAQSWEWARQNGNGYIARATSGVPPSFQYLFPQVACDRFGNVCMFGSFLCETISFGADTILSGYTANMFLTKYDSSGNVIWLKSIYSPASSIFGYIDYAHTIALDAAGNIYIAGNCGDTVLNFGTYELHNSNSDIGSFLAKYDSNGNFKWALVPPGTTSDASVYTPVVVKTDLAGYIYYTYYDTIYNTIISKYDSLGNELWKTKITGTGALSAIALSAMTVDSMGDVIIAGKGYGSINFGAYTLSLSGGADIFIAKHCCPVKSRN